MPPREFPVALSSKWFGHTAPRGFSGAFSNCFGDNVHSSPHLLFNVCNLSGGSGLIYRHLESLKFADAAVAVVFRHDGPLDHAAV